ncbi:PAS domain S-box protein [Massilia arenosa]|uniref:PAS domain S-box protein n=1 Tax=Zemynaea arenosa TaxID=2561931 RepID=A0A4Y9SHX1_9BURK|nr:CheR family methyltransferase [Massilia arenosa]TFW21221.1 PAS domain S-box protein [Massilia arenosa]
MTLPPTPSLPLNEPALIRSSLDFPVVGIGASAGGLPALIRLFENMPARDDLAIVIILHLSPKHQSTADAVLQRYTRMPVEQVSASTPIERGHVYIIAPNVQLSMNDNYLHIAPMDRPRGQHVAIDVFFRTLADVHRERAIAVVLSGTGADGAVGLARIKEQGGVTVVQAPSDAEYDGMPSAAIGTGMVDFVLPAMDIPQKLLELAENARRIELPALGDGEVLPLAHPPASAALEAEDALQNILGMLAASTGHDFRHYKRATVLRRIERRLQVRGLSSLPQYRDLLLQDPGEHQALLNDMLIGVTNFFRDRESFDALERDYIPELFRDKARGDEVRAWSAACATGEEAYSVAMLLADFAGTLSDPPSVQVFASDIDEQAIATARAGLYPASIVADVPPSRLRQFFTREDQRYRIRKAVRDRILFATHNILRDPPFSKLDLISCRNLLIYLNRDVQLRVLEMFHFALRPGGILFLGGSESAEAAGSFFTPLDKKHRIYRARPLSRLMRFSPPVAPVRMPRVADQPPLPVATPRPASYAELHERGLVMTAAPSVVVDRDSSVVYMSEQAARFLRMPGGEPSRNVLTLVIPELRIELRAALYQCQQSGNNVDSRSVHLTRADVDVLVQVRVRRFREDKTEQDYYLISFEEQPNRTPPDSTRSYVDGQDSAVTLLEAELLRTKDQLQETIEQAEVSTEELRASNEELQAINEELRSATEELETSKEELQSVNEELVTVNYELKVKVEETGKANDDLNNLIASTDIATVFVDSAMRIKRFTPRATDIFSMIPGDIGRSLLDITHRLDYDQLAEDVETAFDTLRPVEREVRHNDGGHYIVRLLPYRTTEDKIEGAVMTFFDITRRREAEERVRASEERMRLVADSTRDFAIITLDLQGQVTSWNKGAERIFGYVEQDIVGRPIGAIFTPEDLASGAPEDELRRARADGRSEDERWHLRRDGARVFCSGVTNPLIRNGELSGYAKIARDRAAGDGPTVDSRHQANPEGTAAQEELLATVSHELRHPLNLAQINLELLHRAPGVRQSPLAAKALDAIRNALRTQHRLIEDLLDLSRIATGKLHLEIAPVPLIPLAESIIDGLRADPGSSSLTIDLVLPAGAGMMVRADPVRLEQILMNLLGNAIKFTPAGGTVTLRLAQENEMARLDVCDTGTGIAPDYLPRVFDMFGQGPTSLAQLKPGLGIGLALVKQIVVLLGGRVEAHSAGTGYGTRISLWLPLTEGQDPLPAEAVGEDLRAAVAGKRILLVDDTDDVLWVFRSLLEMEGATVFTADGPQQALELLAREPMDLLISDLAMPGMDGYAFIEQVHAVAQHGQLPAIAVSGMVRPQDVEHARAAGFAAFLGKPVSVERLAEAIRTLPPRPGAE